MSNPTAAIVVIGNEVLSGRIADANVHYIARRLTDSGIDLKEVRVVRDSMSAIGEAVLALAESHTYVLTTGGIGPTHDDISMAAIAKAFGVRIARDAQVEEKLRQYYANRLMPATLRMADYPEGARIVWHGENFAPGCMFRNVIIMAGSPTYMQPMFEAALPLLQQGTPAYTKTIDAFVYESQIAEPLTGIQSQYPSVEIGSYPYKSENRAATSLVMKGADGKEVEDASRAVEKMLLELGAEIRHQG
jgi:molybdenum cofactor synthesis domain-containing protein